VIETPFNTIAAVVEVTLDAIAASIQAGFDPITFFV